MWKFGRPRHLSIAFNKIRITNVYWFRCLKMFFFPTHDTIGLCVWNSLKRIVGIEIHGKNNFSHSTFKNSPFPLLPDFLERPFLVLPVPEVGTEFDHSPDRNVSLSNQVRFHIHFQFPECVEISSATVSSPLSSSLWMNTWFQSPHCEPCTWERHVCG